MTIKILQGDCREVLRTLADASVDSIVTDPPYHLTTGKKGGTGEASASLNTPHGRARVTTGFMGMTWDGGDVAQDPAMWAECLRVLKPGGYLLAFSGTRTYHRMACAIEDAGFEVRDQIGWLYGSGFPKSLDVSKAIDKHLGAKREVVGAIPDRWTGKGNALNFSTDRPQTEVAVTGEAVTGEAVAWAGWGTALKPAWEPICMARKPLIGTVAENVLAHGTGALNIDGCRVPTDDDLARVNNPTATWDSYGSGPNRAALGDVTGRWPANLIHDCSNEVLACFPQAGGQQGVTGKRKQGAVYGTVTEDGEGVVPRGDTGSAARFFYCAKASAADRGDGNTHPTVKPTELMRYLCRLVTPPGGTVLDPFAGSGSTLKAAELEGFSAVGIELSPEYIEIARRRIAADMPLFAEVLA